MVPGNIVDIETESGLNTTVRKDTLEDLQSSRSLVVGAFATSDRMFRPNGQAQRAGTIGPGQWMGPMGLACWDGASCARQHVVLERTSEGSEVFRTFRASQACAPNVFLELFSNVVWYKMLLQTNFRTSRLEQEQRACHRT